MADVKVSGLPSDSSLDGNHYFPLNDPVGPTTKRTLLSTLATFLFNQVNIPDGSGSPRTRMTQIEFDFVSSGCVWSGDAYASTRVASMSSGIVYINGRQLTMSAVVSRTFTASRDTYIDILDNGDGTATIVYTEVTNNNASPALAANSLRIGIIVTGASNIAAVGSVNQGQIDKILPIVSSIPYAVTDSLGNLICNRDPNKKLLGARRLVTTQATSSQTAIQMTSISVPFIAVANRKVKATLVVPKALKDSVVSQYGIGIWLGTVGSGTLLQYVNGLAHTANVNYSIGPAVTEPHVPATGLNTYNGSLQSDPGGPNTVTITGAATGPIYLMIEME